MVRERMSRLRAELMEAWRVGTLEQIGAATQAVRELLLEAEGTDAFAPQAPDPRRQRAARVVMVRRPRSIVPEGTRYGMLVVVRLVPGAYSNTRGYEVRCDCGNVKIVRWGNLQQGITKSCGCGRRR